MNYKLILFVLLSFVLNISYSQKQTFNGYKYIYVEQLNYQNGIDIHGIVQQVKNNLIRKGFKIFDGNANFQVQKEIAENPCLLLNVTINHTANTSPTILWGKNLVSISIRNCKNEEVYSGEGKCGAADYKISSELRSGAEKALNDFDKINYSFNSSLTPEMQFPMVERTNETEKSIKNYLDNNRLDPIEGIYKSYQDDNLGYYKFGIIRSGDKFKAVIIESDKKQWRAGEVKAYFEQSSVSGFYSVKWYMGDKTTTETFCTLEHVALLSIDIKDLANNSNNQQSKFIKMYPEQTKAISIKPDESKASGSGFFITTNGIVATNAHVIEDAKKVDLVLANEFGTFTYKTKVLLNDSKNDVALIQIDDSSFKGLSIIPYSLIEKTEVGEKVFTIGFPLNDIMGTNYKVTDGIISSQSGVADDIRFFQITVPIQPGNSGGPLFNRDGNIIGIASSKLNSKAVGVDIENVNYAIKISYLLNLYNMLPKSNPIPNSSKLTGKELKEQVKVLKNYVCLLKIY